LPTLRGGSRSRPRRIHPIYESGFATEEDPQERKNHQGETPRAAHLSQKGREGAPPQREPHSFKKVIINSILSKKKAGK